MTAILDADGLPSLKQNPRRERVDLEAQVRALLGGAQIAGRGAAAPSPAGGGLVVAGALLRRAVEVVVARDAERHRRGDEGVAELVLVGEIADFEGTADAVPCVGAARLVLRLLEVRQQVVEA